MQNGAPVGLQATRTKKTDQHINARYLLGLTAAAARLSRSSAMRRNWPPERDAVHVSNLSEGRISPHAHRGGQDGVPT